MRATSADIVTRKLETMDWQLDATETRVLGALLEKEITTPDYYPLSTNALVNACNQKSNREKFNLGRREAALLCVLMLRGPQTVGELRGRSERLYTFDDLEAVESTLARLAEMEYVKKLPRRTGFKEQRWAHLLAGDVEEVGEAAAPAAERGPGDRERIARLEADFAALKLEFEEFRRKFD